MARYGGQLNQKAAQPRHSGPRVPLQKAGLRKGKSSTSVRDCPTKLHTIPQHRMPARPPVLKSAAPKRELGMECHHSHDTKHPRSPSRRKSDQDDQRLVWTPSPEGSPGNNGNSKLTLSSSNRRPAAGRRVSQPEGYPKADLKRKRDDVNGFHPPSTCTSKPQRARVATSFAL